MKHRHRAGYGRRGMHLFSGKIILIIMSISLLLGFLVVLFNPDYTIEKNIRSNKDYYPSVKVTVEGDSNASR
jgi:hypothetical protein